MLFWVTTIARYLLAGFVALALSIVISFLITLPFGQADSPKALGLLWIIVFLPVTGLLIPLCLGVSAELIERKVAVRRFEWPKALLRSLLALPIAVGPAYAFVCVFPYVESHRPTNWVGKEIFLYSLSCVFAYFALRIKRRPMLSAP